MSGDNTLEKVDLRNEDAILKVVRDAYNAEANNPGDVEHAKRVSEAFGYTPTQLQSIPTESNLGLSCGNPVAAASIKKGETILDLGSGGGIDVFLAASAVGPHGKVIGLDMSPEMISLARRNASKRGLRPPHVSFIQASLTETLAIASNSVDCVLSNCVFNLLPTSGKTSLLKELSRVLKPRGRLIFDDIIAKVSLPEAIRSDLACFVNCISGAIQLDTYRNLLEEAGFADPTFIETLNDLNVYHEIPGGDSAVKERSCCNCISQIARPSPVADFNANMWVASYQVYVLKPGVENFVTSEAPVPLLQWWDAYPNVKSTPGSVTCDELAELIRHNTATFAVIDVRRNDHAGGHVRGSFQWPAQTFHDDLAAFFEKRGNAKKVIFYCGRSQGRGPRCAGWYQDFLDERGLGSSAAYVLHGGIKAWLETYQDLVDRD